MKRLLLITAVLIGCGQVKEPSKLKYGFPNFNWQTLRSFSMLQEIYDNQGEITIALQYRGIAPSYDQDQAMRQAIARAVREWTGATDERFPYKNPVVKIGPYGSHIVYVDAGVSRSFVVYTQKEMFFAGNLLDQSNPISYKTMLHEIGHLMGLADTYSEPGVQTPVGQPQAIMNVPYYLPGLQPDDITAINALWDYLQRGVLFCADGYGRGGAYQNNNAVFFCVPAAKPTPL